MRTKYCAGVGRGKMSNSRGFTMIELIIVMVILCIATAMAIPIYSNMARNLRITGDIRDLNGIVAEAKMRAAQDYTHARVRANLAAKTFQLEVWDKTANGGAGCWKTDGDSVNRCTVSASPVQSLSPGVTFGFGTAGAAAPNPQAVIAQAPACNTGVAGGAAGSGISNTACIEFNSRGLPVAGSGSPNAGSPTANDALYVTDANTVNGVTVIVSGLIQIWSTSASTTAWQAR